MATVPSLLADGAAILADLGIQSQWFAPATARRRLLVVYAHPDDESFGNAGTILRYSMTGVSVHYVCATRGECGTVKPEFLEGYADIGALRTAELNSAARALGLAGLHMLGYRDSGMEGSADNQHPNALVRAPLERVTEQVVAAIRLIRPQVVLTFGPYGGYGHPDHITMHKATLAALEASGNRERFPDQIDRGLEAWVPGKLYYPTSDTRGLRLLVPLLRVRGMDPRRVGENNDIDLVKALAEATPITTSIWTGAFLERKQQAILAHRSQIGAMGGLQRLPRAVQRYLLSTEHFTRVYPDWGPQRVRERDLFARIDP